MPPVPTRGLAQRRCLGHRELKKHKNHTAPGHVIPSWPLPPPTCPPPHSLSGPITTNDDNRASQLRIINNMTTGALTSAEVPTYTLTPARSGQCGQAGAEEHGKRGNVNGVPTGSLTWARGLTQLNLKEAQKLLSGHMGPLFTDEETEALRAKAADLGPHGQWQPS